MAPVGPITPVDVGPASRNGGRTASELLAWGRTIVEPALRKAVDGIPSTMRHISGYHFGWWDSEGRPENTQPGKAIRPTLVLLSAQAAGSPHAEFTSSEALRAAVAVELVHNFSLLHDDVMDGDLTRRHRATAWSVFGEGPAILAGDALLTLAFDELAIGKETLRDAVLRLLEGQHSDLAFEGRTDVSMAEAEEMAEEKTSVLLGCCCALGAMAAGASPPVVERFQSFGQRIGLAFQHIDDLLGIWGDPLKTGKPSHSDLFSRKKSLPIVAALTSGTTAGDALAALFESEEPLSVDDLEFAAQLVERAGGREWSRKHAAALLDAALDDLRAACPESAARSDLATVAMLIADRDR